MTIENLLSPIRRRTSLFAPLDESPDGTVPPEDDEPTEPNEENEDDDEN